LEFEFEFGEFSRHFQNSNSPNIREFEYEFELGEFLPTPGSKTVAVEEAHAPQTKTAMRRFLGMTGYCRKFIDNYAKRPPSSRVSERGVEEPFQLTDEALKAHQDVIVPAPVLALHKRKGTFAIETDASASKLGMHLLQEQDDKSWQPIGFWSRQCNQAECNYSPTEREALSIVWGIKVCRPYLKRTRFKVRSDHQSLRWLFETSSSDGSPHVLRWKLALAADDFTVKYKTGASNRVADELSRMDTDFHSPLTILHEEGDMIPCLVVQFDADDLMRSPGTPLKSPFCKFQSPWKLSPEMIYTRLGPLTLGVSRHDGPHREKRTNHTSRYGNRFKMG
jgi:RNase H-like domain found in reverse transcriptase